MILPMKAAGFMGVSEQVGTDAAATNLSMDKVSVFLDRMRKKTTQTKRQSPEGLQGSPAKRQKKNSTDKDPQNITEPRSKRPRNTL